MLCRAGIDILDALPVRTQPSTLSEIFGDKEGRLLRAIRRRAADLRRVPRRAQQDALVPLPASQRGRRRALGGLFCAFGAYALGSAASSIGSTITIVGWAVAGALTASTIVIGRRSLRRLEQRAEDAFPRPPPALSHAGGPDDMISQDQVTALAQAPTDGISVAPGLPSRRNANWRSDVPQRLQPPDRSNRTAWSPPKRTAPPIP
jgi:hypothetical protein